ncbi:MAG: DNA polymerase III subunit beta [Deltaproteobacteria bacterium]|nr:DNA polymerase III subunit beta [Deltaproteobacteria bacterium]
MEIVAPKKNLEKLLARCQGVADKKSTMPVLANVLLSAEGNALTISATDLQLTISGTLEAEVKRPGSVALPARDVHDRVRAMPDGPIKITVANGSATTVQAVGSARRYTIHGLPGSDFPQLPEPAADAVTIDISVAMLQKLVKRTIFSISNDETRPHLNSALFECRPAKGGTAGTVRMVTTDGHRLSKMEVSLDGLRAETTMLIPHKAMQELRKLFDDVVDNRDSTLVSIAQTGPNAFFKLAGVRFSVKLIDAQFPPYEQVIPSATDRHVVAGRTAFMDALKAVSLAASDRTYGVKLAIGAGALRISSESPESGNGFDEIPVEYDGPELSVGFNAQYLQHVLGAMDVEEEVSLGLSGELDPAVLRPAGDASTDFVAVVMPMRI